MNIRPIVGAMTCALICSCGSSSQPVAAPPAPLATGAVVTPARVSQVTSITVGETFSPKNGTAALHAFKPEIAPFDSGGECSIIRTSGSGATLVTAGFPNRATSKMTVSMSFDSAGHLIRYSEIRNPIHTGPLTGMSDAQRDSARRAATNAIRSTNISLDWAIDQAIARNSGGGRPTDAIIGTVRSLEQLEQLDNPPARRDRVRKLCGA